MYVVKSLPATRLRQSYRFPLASLLIISAVCFWLLFRDEPLRLPTLRYTSEDDKDQSEPLQLPAVYAPHTSDDDDWCQARFGMTYLTNARDSSVSYCAEDTSSHGMTCLWSNTASGNNRNDALCHGRGAVFDAAEKKFSLSCEPRNASDDAASSSGLKFPDHLPAYWYETGPAVINRKAIKIVGSEETGAPPAQAERNTILVQREGSRNPWHSLMEIMSLSWSLDILQVTPITDERGRQAPLLNPASGNNTQIVLMDDHDDGPYIDLWRLFAKMPIRRLRDLGPEEPTSNIIIPLAGGSNTLWQGDWDVLPCRDGSLARAFAHRVLEHYDVPTPQCRDVVTVTYVRRRGTRKLLDEDSHIEALREGIPHVALEVVDFDGMPFKEQLSIARQTDVLVGVHGAGLTHALFQQQGSVVVEIQPEGFNHQGFRNLAQMLGHAYLRTHGELQPGSTGGGDAWQMQDVQIQREKLISVVRTAVSSMYTTCERSYDAS